MQWVTRKFFDGWHSYYEQHNSRFYISNTLIDEESYHKDEKLDRKAAECTAVQQQIAFVRQTAQQWVTRLQHHTITLLRGSPARCSTQHNNMMTQYRHVMDRQMDGQARCLQLLLLLLLLLLLQMSWITVLPSHSYGGTWQKSRFKLLHSSMQTSADHRSRRRHVSHITDEKGETLSPSGSAMLSGTFGKLNSHFIHRNVQNRFAHAHYGCVYTITCYS